jgi:hypothetical protein
MPDWTPSIVDLPEWPVCHIFKGGTWAGALGFDALGVSEGGFQEQVMLMLSNELGCVIVCHDYRPGGVGLPQAEDVERVFWPEILDDGAQVVQYFKLIANDARWGDRPLTRDPNLIVGYGSSSGAHRLAFSQIMPDGAFDYSPNRLTRDLYLPQHSHVMNPMILSTCPVVLSTFSKGGTGYSYYTTYGEASWPYALFSSSQHEEDPGWGWDDVPMELKRQSDLGEHIRPDNPRVSQIGLYLTSSHEFNFIPRSSIRNDPSGADPRSFKRLYWRYLGIDPAPIENVRPVVDNVESIASAVPGEGIFRAAASWVTAGYAAGQIVATSGFPTPFSTNDAFAVLRFENGDLDMVVQDTADLVLDHPANVGQTVAGGGHYSLHDEWCCYVTYDEMLAQGNTRCRLRAGNAGNTNPDPLTTVDLATADDVRDWLTATDGTGFNWVIPA